VNGTSTRRAPAERPGGRWKTGVAATANGPGSLRTERAGRAGASRLRRKGRWKTGVAATANGPGSLRTERAGRAGASRLRRRAPAISDNGQRRSDGPAVPSVT